MKKRNEYFVLAACSALAFLVWTIAVCLIDVRAIGPNHSAVGLASLNKAFHDLTGVHMRLYTITDWLSLVPVGFVFGFAALGLIQWIRRKRLQKVDADILVLGGFYIVTMAAYILFECVVINYRPVLIEGYLEASYPSSTTILVLCVMPTAMLQFCRRIRNRTLAGTLNVLIGIFTVFMVIGRLISGVHWLSDIVGGILLSTGLDMLYFALNQYKKPRNSDE